ncbi:MAG: tRNA guanosine(34) transglycosylase Tgt [Deltaproteobacteria bacterium]|nr:tRNA guanosine(34) transglycosylase Tgt [Deltaproteobacteria bacterium]
MKPTFTILASDPATGARAGVLDLGRVKVETPVLMPVGTYGAVKALSPEDVESTGTKLILANTYHLFLRPGHKLISALGGLHRFMGWDGGLLTDSGGFQVFSLAKLRKITEDGVSFRSHVDGSEQFLSPEAAMEAQRAFGSDIAMVLDECPPPDADRAYIEKSMRLTTRWAGRCLEAMAGSDQGCFGIVQGGFHENLRLAHLDEIASMPFDGLALGGLSVGEDRGITGRIVESVAPRMPEDRPRYLMGVGMPEDLVRYSGHGVDMFDCVVPTRNARNGQVFTSAGRLNVRNASLAEDGGPLDPACGCAACRRFSRAYVRHVFMSNEILAHRLLTLHNLAYFRDLMRRVRGAIIGGRYGAFVREFTEGPEARGQVWRTELKSR